MFICIPDCGDPKEIDNGKITVENDQTTYQSTASVTCDTGYDASIESVTCQENGEWLNASCTIKGITIALKLLSFKPVVSFTVWRL